MKAGKTVKVRAGLLLVAALTALLGCSLLACGGSGPEAAVKGALEALGAMDAEKTASYFPEDEREDIIGGLEIAFKVVRKIKIYNINTLLVVHTENEATVNAECDIEGTILFEQRNAHMEDTIKLEKVEGRWLIIESELLERRDLLQYLMRL